MIPQVYDPTSLLSLTVAMLSYYRLYCSHVEFIIDLSLVILYRSHVGFIIDLSDQQ